MSLSRVPILIYCVIIIVSVSTISVHAKWDLEKILSLCDDDSCDVAKDVEISKYSDARYHQRLAHYITGGVSDILWSHIRNKVDANTGVATKDVNLSKSCVQNLKTVINDANNGRKWAFEMMASTGKTPELLSHSTLTSLGDYDTCLAVDNLALDSIQGKYCLVDMFPMKFSNKSEDEFSLDKLTIFKYFPFKTGVCIPNGCSERDMTTLLTDALQDYPLIVKGSLTCDTKESVSWITRFKNLNAHQIISLIFLLSVVAITSFATYYHVIAKYIFNDDGCEKNDLLMCLSCWSNMRKLPIKSKGKNNRFFVVDNLKLFTVYVGTISHFMVSLEIPNSFLMLDRHVNMNKIFSRSISQTIMNENGLTIFAFLGGFLMFVSLYPLAKGGKISYFMLIVMRYIHFLPSLICLTAAEFVWTFLFDGPFYTKVSNYVLQKCTNNWWRNLFFIQNLYPSLETCAGHSFSMANDFQLFLLGLIVLFLISKNIKLGFTFGILASIYSYADVAHRAIKYETTGTFFTPFPTPIKIVEYLQFIYMSTEIYVPSYMLGLYVGYLYHYGYKFKVETLWDHIYYLGVIGIVQNMVSVINGLANEFNLIPQSLTFLQIVSNRILFTASIAISFMYFLSLDSIYGIKLDRIESNLVSKRRTNIDNPENIESRDVNNNVSKDEAGQVAGSTSDNVNTSTSSSPDAATDRTVRDMDSKSTDKEKNEEVEYSFLTALCRTLITLDWYFLLKRLTGSMFFCLIWAFTYYCFFVAPFDALNKRYIFSRFTKKESSQKKEKVN